MDAYYAQPPIVRLRPSACWYRRTVCTARGVHMLGACNRVWVDAVTGQAAPPAAAHLLGDQDGEALGLVLVGNLYGKGQTDDGNAGRT